MAEQATAPVDIRRGEHERVSRNFGLDFKLLHPWPGMTTPFRGAWCIVRPGDVTEPHAHGEDEIMIAMAGGGVLVTDEGRIECAAGDIVFMPANTGHSVVNEGDEDFSYYSIWWDRAMSTEFLDAESGE
ncbi:cupin domain-containing protein [Actinosynnema sp. CS-041913]|uniref:cupin domain-containing protein n=1 Tax=Actinosynnema sp. CS-041913 TaxID=3239917 RepID=UPI003D91580A